VIAMTIKPKILLVGPYPPPIGGIATFIKNILLEKNLSNDFELSLHRTSINGSKILIHKFITEIKQLNSYIYKYDKVTIFHIHTSSYLGFYRNVPYVFIGKYFHSGKIILHIHGGGFEKFYLNCGNISKRIIEYTLKFSSTIIVTSLCWIPVIKDISEDMPPVYAICNGFDDKIFRPMSGEEARNKLSLPLDKKIILTIGDLEHHKGHKFLIESMKNIVQLEKNAFLCIIGDGSLKSHLINLINSYSLDSNIVLVSGNKPANELALWYNACDIFVLPSLIEGNPTVMFECLACGKPFIGTRVGGIPDIIKSEEYGYIVEPGNSAELLKIILIAMSKEWNRDIIHRYANQFTWEEIGRSLKEIYIDLLDEN
jgi:teichuronic acid biosynthesis glycosyltransferase TuaC